MNLHTLEDLQTAIKQALAARGETAAQASLNAGFVYDAIDRILDGHWTSFERAATILDYLGCGLKIDQTAHKLLAEVMPVVKRVIAEEGQQAAFGASEQPNLQGKTHHFSVEKREELRRLLLDKDPAGNVVSANPDPRKDIA